MIAIELSPEIEKKLAAYAIQAGTSEGLLAQRAIIEFLEDMEDISLAEQRLAENNPRISFEEMQRRLGLNG